MRKELQHGFRDQAHLVHVALVGGHCAVALPERFVASRHEGAVRPDLRGFGVLQTQDCKL